MIDLEKEFVLIEQNPCYFYKNILLFIIEVKLINGSRIK
jgi:hypothetical protein